MEPESPHSPDTQSSAVSANANRGRAKLIGRTVGILYAIFAWWGVGVVLNCGGDMCGLVAMPIAFLLLPSSLLINFIPSTPQWPGTLIVIAIVVFNSWLVSTCVTKLAAHFLRRQAR
jgi:hypothetical protein